MGESERLASRVVELEGQVKEQEERRASGEHLKEDLERELRAEVAQLKAELEDVKSQKDLVLDERRKDAFRKFRVLESEMREARLELELRTKRAAELHAELKREEEAMGGVLGLVGGLFGTSGPGNKDRDSRSIALARETWYVAEEKRKQQVERVSGMEKSLEEEKQWATNVTSQRGGKHVELEKEIKVRHAF